MTQLLSLYRKVFGKQTKSHYLEQYINSQNPNCHQQVEELARDSIYHFSTLKGL